MSRVARLVQFASYTVEMRIDSAPWPFEEELPPRPPEDIEEDELLNVGQGGTSEDTGGEASADGADTTDDQGGEGGNNSTHDENSEGSDGAEGSEDGAPENVIESEE